MRHNGLVLGAVILVSACAGRLDLGGGPRGGGGAPSSSSSGSGGGYVVEGTDGGGTAVAPPTPLSDLGFEIKEMTGDFTSAWIVDKLMTFNVSDACMKRIVADEAGGLAAVRDAASNIHLYAKVVTKEDWWEIEHQNSDVERNKQLVEPMIDDFRKVFHLTVNLEGDDCDTQRGSLWQQTYLAAVSAVLAYPPATGRAFITVNVSPKLRKVSATADADGSTFTIEGPRDIEDPALNAPIEKMFKRVWSPR